MDVFRALALGICLFAAIAKMLNPHFTFGGPSYRTPFWSSAFFLGLSFLIALIRCEG